MEFAAAINQFLQVYNIAPAQIEAIGSHGQNIYHHPHPPYPFTLQIGDPNTIAALTGITTVADFRRKDLAYGGQGAPLVPAFHAEIFRHPHKNRVIVNIGGIANITVLPADPTQPVIGFDTGPGNALLDSWIAKHLEQTHDHDGKWAAQGQYSETLLNALLSDPYFFHPSPKSTGREYFNLNWLKNFLPFTAKPVDIQATLVELTARSIIDAINKHMLEGEIFVCGGGAHNAFLMQRLGSLAKNYTVSSTQTLHISPDWIEAMAFAWLAKQTLEKKPGNMPQVTGARQTAILGGIYHS